MVGAVLRRAGWMVGLMALHDGPPPDVWFADEPSPTVRNWRGGHVWVPVPACDGPGGIEIGDSIVGSGLGDVEVAFRPGAIERVLVAARIRSGGSQVGQYFATDRTESRDGRIGRRYGVCVR